MSSFKARLRSAQQLYVQQNYAEALRACESALEANEESQDAMLLQGKICFQLKDFVSSERAYQRALQEHPKQLAAWKGLAELHTATGNTAAAAAAFESLIEHGTSESTEKRQEYHAKLAGLYTQLQQPGDAKKHLEPLLHGKLAYSDAKSRLHAACQMADVQIMLGQDDAALQSDLASIVSQTNPDAQYAQYHARSLELALRSMEKLQAGSAERLKHLEACQEQIKQMLMSPTGGCCSPLPFKQTLVLSEEQGMASNWIPGKDAQGSLQQVYRTLQHQFPWEPAACTAAGLALHQKHTQKSRHPSKTQDRTRVAQFLDRVLRHKVDSVHAWLLLSEVRLQNKQFDLAAEAAGQGIKCLHQRQSRGYQVLPELSAKLVLARGLSLFALGNATDAVPLLEALTDDSCSSPVKKMLGTVPSAVHQAAVRAQAQSLQQDNRLAEAAALLQSLVKQQDQEQLQHEMCADYGSILRQQEKLEDAKVWLRWAIDKAAEAGSAATDLQLADYKRELGGICWGLGTASQADRAEAHSHWLAAAAVQGPHQSAVFAKLGIWYAQVKADVPRARKCFQRSLGLNPLQREAGEGLCGLLRQEGKADTAKALCQEVTGRAAAAVWAWRLLGFYSLEGAQHEKAVQCFQTSLRGDVKCAAAWEGLGSAYQSLARLTAALKAYGRAIELEPQRLFSLSQSGMVLLGVGNYPEAREVLQRAVQADPTHVPALFAAAQLALATAKYRIAQGTPGMAAQELAAAAQYCATCSQEKGNSEAIWKLTGDVHLQYHATTPMQDGLLGSSIEANGVWEPAQGSTQKGVLHCVLQGWNLRIEAMHTARRAYQKALHLAPQQGSLWGDLGATLYHEAQLRRVHPKLQPEQAQQLRGKAERLLRGGLRLDGSSAPLWAGLGVCAWQPHVQEYGLLRSLQLDPKSAQTWAALGRLYMQAGARHLADSCFTQARSQDPADPATWTAMGALAGLSATGATDKADVYEHAVKLGAGPEALAGFAEGAVAEGRASTGRVYAAARRVAEAQPYSAAAQNILGLACEARGDFTGAVAAYRAGMDVLQDDRNSQDEPLLSGPLHKVQQGTQQPSSLQQAIQLNQARALMRQASGEEAVSMYRKLEDKGAMSDQPLDWLAYGLALQQANTADAVAAAQHAVAQGLAAHPSPEAQAALLHAMVKLRPGAGIHHLYQQLEDLKAAKPSLAALKPLWLTITAAATAAGPQAAESAKAFVQEWMVEADLYSAELAADVVGVDVLHLQHVGQSMQAARQAARAAHICPWGPSQQAALCTTAMAASATAAPAVAHLSSQSKLLSLQQATQSYKELPDESLPVQALQDVAAAGMSGQACQPCGAAELESAQQQYRAQLQWTHSMPYSLTACYLLAAAATRLAAISQQAGHAQSALALCKRAMHMLSATSASSPQAALPPNGTNNGNHVVAMSQQQQAAQAQQAQHAQQQQHMKVQLHCMMSQCQLQDRQSTAEQALATAKTAVQTASGFKDTELVAASLQQLSRCLGQMHRHKEAEMACRKALNTKPDSLPAAAQLCGLLHIMQQHSAALDALDQAKQHLQQPMLQTRPQLKHQWRAALLLLRSQALASLHDLEGACGVCEEAMEQSIAAGSHLQLHGCTTQIWYAQLVLQWSEHSSADSLGSALLLAHKVVTQVVSASGQSSRADMAIAFMLLAKLDLLGNLRRKQERAEAHAMQAFDVWPQPAPSSLYSLLSTLRPEGQPWTCKAVHQEPWNAAYWQQLQEVAEVVV